MSGWLSGRRRPVRRVVAELSVRRVTVSSATWITAWRYAVFEHTMYCSICQDTRGFYRPWTAEDLDDPALDGEELACGVCGTAVLVDPVLYAAAARPVRRAA